MKKKIIALALLAIFVLSGMTALVFAKESKDMGMSKNMAVVDVGNKMCPLLDGKADGKTFMVYKGKRYGFCCPGCEKEFKKNPEKYIAKLKETEKDLKTL
jgi:YHS domain-containing protein